MNWREGLYPKKRPIESGSNEKKEPKSMSDIGSRTQASERDEKDVSGQNSEAAARDEAEPREVLN
jgi:hypothetical protein